MHVIKTWLTKCDTWWGLDFVLQEFFGQLDQRVLNTFLKACDELTDILPEQEQQSLQETVRKLHKHWKVSAWLVSFFKCKDAAPSRLQRHYDIFLSPFLIMSIR